MTIKEHAQYLVNKMAKPQNIYQGTALAKECAIILVDEVIPIIESYEDALGADQRSDYADYWRKIKEQIQSIEI